MRGLYSTVALLALPIILLRVFWRSRRQPEYRKHLGERFGRYAPLENPGAGITLWLHAVSVGEMRAAQPLIAGLRARLPQCHWLLTCMTPTGRATAQSLYGEFATIVYLPYDLPGLGARFLHHFKPIAGLLMETEVWPNLMSAAAQARVPTVLVNARLSARSARGYQRLSALTRPAFAHLRLTMAQTDADGARLIECGASPVAVSGNLKFDLNPDAGLVARGGAWRQAHAANRRVIVAASTRDGEEALILEAFAKLRVTNVLLILVPRHPQRFSEVARLVASRGARLMRRSVSMPAPDTQVWLGDSMGEMASYFACADLGLMGGSFKPFGSQNLIEGCACGCPMIVGPSDFNFSQATADALATGAAVRVEATPDAIAAEVDQWLSDSAALAVRREAALAFAAAHRGAAARMAAAILEILPGQALQRDLLGQQ